MVDKFYFSGSGYFSGCCNFSFVVSAEMITFAANH
jgi:hypothetical protein